MSTAYPQLTDRMQSSEISQRQKILFKYSSSSNGTETSNNGSKYVGQRNFSKSSVSLLVSESLLNLMFLGLYSGVASAHEFFL